MMKRIDASSLRQTWSELSAAGAHRDAFVGDGGLAMRGAATFNDDADVTLWCLATKLARHSRASALISGGIQGDRQALQAAKGVVVGTLHRP